MRRLGLLSTFILLLLCLGCTVFLVTPESPPSPAAVPPKPGSTATVVPPPMPAVQPTDTVAPTSEPSPTVTPYPSETPKREKTAMPENIVFTVVYENLPYKKGLKTNWGFACVISGTERTILFDTGGDSPTLWRAFWVRTPTSRSICRPRSREGSKSPLRVWAGR